MKATWSSGSLLAVTKRTLRSSAPASFLMLVVSASTRGLPGFRSTAKFETEGTISRISSRRFVPSSVLNKLSPMALPVALRLSTRPPAIGSTPVTKTIVGLGCRLCWPCRRAIRDDKGNMTANEVGRQCWHAIELVLRPSVFDRDVLALDIAGFLQTLTERG